jgi:hypothetical protein
MNTKISFSFIKDLPIRNYFGEIHNLSSRLCDAILPFHYSTVHMSYSRADDNRLNEELTPCNPTDIYTM